MPDATSAAKAAKAEKAEKRKALVDGILDPNAGEEFNHHRWLLYLLVVLFRVEKERLKFQSV